MSRRLGLVVLAFLSVCAFLMAGEEEGRQIKSEEKYKVALSKPLTVQLEVTAGEVIFEKSPEADCIFTKFEYTENEFRPKIEFNEKKNRIMIRLSKKSWHNVEKGDGKNWACVTVRLPSGPDIYLISRLKAGEAKMRLGGLRLKEVDLAHWAGELSVDFDTPNLIPMDYLEINPKIGEANLMNLGNARYKEAYINGGIGELYVDFKGAVEPDSKAKVDLDIGETTVVLPDTAAVRVTIGGTFSFLSSKQILGSFYKRGRYYYSDDYDEHKPKCTFVITPGLGELKVERGK
jgi:hypothetical protein